MKGWELFEISQKNTQWKLKTFGILRLEPESVLNTLENIHKERKSVKEMKKHKRS